MIDASAPATPAPEKPNPTVVAARKAGVAGILLVALTAIGFTMTLPFVWMALTSLKTIGEVSSDSWIPSRFMWGNYLQVFSEVSFGRYYVNSVFVAAWTTFLQVFTSALAAFGFARLEWPGRDKIFIMYLATMMVPAMVMMIPMYQIMIDLSLVDTFIGLIVGHAFTPFGVFLLRQFMLTIPRELDEAAEIDGASKWQLFWDIILPLSRPGVITLAIFVFVGNYHAMTWPLVMLKSEFKYTLPIGLLYFDSANRQATHLLMAAVTMSVAPLILLFVVLQRYLVKGIQIGAVKG